MNANAVKAVALAAMLGAAPGAVETPSPFAEPQTRAERRAAAKRAKEERKALRAAQAEAKRRRKSIGRARNRRGAK